MKILFIVPPSNLEERYGTFREAGAVYPSIGIAYLAGAARQAGHEVRVIDAEAQQIDMSGLRSRTLDYQPDVVGFQTFCANLRRCQQTATMIKDDLPECRIVFGGVQATLFPDESLSAPSVDYVIRGEADRSFVKLLEVFQGQRLLSEVGGLVYREGGLTKAAEREPLIRDLDSLPEPALDLFSMPLYHSSAQLRGQRTMLMFTSRGCPFDCAYCSGDLIFGSSFRFHSAGRVIQQMRRLRDECDADSIQFYDETFTVSRKRVVELCREINSAGVTMPWACFTRVDLVDEQLLRIMKAAGCYQIFFGVETGVPRLLQLIRKGTTLDQAREAFHLTRKVGIETVASFMLTLPTETERETWQTIQFGLELDPDYVYWLTFTPYPGTDLAEIAQASGTIIHRNYESYNVFNEIVYLPEGRDEAEIRRTVARAYRKFYLRPRYLARRVAGLIKLPPRKTLSLAAGAMRTFLRNRV